MDEALKTLLSSEVFSEETKTKISEAFNREMKLAEAAAEKRVRAELVKEFKNSEATLHTAIESWLEKEIAPHIKELKEGVVEVNSMKKTLAERAAGIEASLKKEFAKRTEFLESTVEDIIKKEIGEIHEDVKTNRRAYLTRMNECETKYQKMSEDLKKKTALVLEMVIEKNVREMLDELRSEIKAANEADFGREIFESFRTLYQRHFFNTNKEVRSLSARAKALSEENASIKAEAKKRIVEAVQKQKMAETAHKKLAESVQLSRTRSELLNTLKGPARERMKAILEACTTVEAMKRNYKNYLSEAVKETVVPSQNKRISEKVIKLKTGNDAPLVEEKVESEISDSDLSEIKVIGRLAGVKRA